MTYEKKTVFLTVKAYPERSKKYGACVDTVQDLYSFISNTVTFLSVKILRGLLAIN